MIASLISLRAPGQGAMPCMQGSSGERSDNLDPRSIAQPAQASDSRS